MRPHSRSLFTAAVALLLSACSGGSLSAEVTIEEPWLRSNPNRMGAAYLTITAPSDDRLVAVEVAADVAARVEVHEVLEVDGMMRMQEVDGGIPLPAGVPVELRPGGYHLMLLDMPAMLEVGATVELTLVLREAGRISVLAEVREGSEASGTIEHLHSGS
jgi:copper(I)-binding protein